MAPYMTPVKLFPHNYGTRNTDILRCGFNSLLEPQVLQMDKEKMAICFPTGQKSET